MAIQYVDTEGELAPELLFERHYDEIVEFLSRDIPANLFQLCWVENHGVRPVTNPDLYAYRGIRAADGSLRAVALIITDRLALIESVEPETARGFGRWCRREGVQFEHVVSAAESVRPFWSGYRMEPPDGTSLRFEPKARLVRPQTMYVLDRRAWRTKWAEPSTRPEPTATRRATLGDLDPLFFASAHMHREETLEDPLERNPSSFRQHVRHRVESDRSFVWFNEACQLQFKADISAKSRFGVQLSGVYTAPQLRGRGIATRALFDICDELFEDGVPRIVLYVNRENEPARRVYEKIGFDLYTDYETVFVARSS